MQSCRCARVRTASIDSLTAKQTSMTRTHSRSVNIFTVVSLALVMLFGAFGQSASAQDKVSKDQLNKLIATARTPAEHQRIADYYQGQARQYQAQVDEHNAMIAAYKANPSSKHQAALLTHCQNLVTDLKDLSTKSQELAHMHQQMANEAAAK
jgi:hypothetical protein